MPSAPSHATQIDSVERNDAARTMPSQPARQRAVSIWQLLHLYVSRRTECRATRSCAHSVKHQEHEHGLPL